MQTRHAGPRLFFVLLILQLMLGLAAAPRAGAVSTKSLTDEAEADFVKGELKSTSLSADGVISIAPAMRTVFETGEAMVWDVVQGDNGDLYVATGHEGKVFHYDAKNTTGTLYCDLPEVEATALALSEDGDLYVGASPGGVIYRVREQDEPTTFFLTKEVYVWDLALDEDGVLYAATGIRGKIFSVQPSGTGEVYFDSKAANVLSLDKTEGKPLLAATQKPALALEITAKGKGRVLTDGAPYEELRGIARGERGAVYVAFNADRTSPLDRLRMLTRQAGSGGSEPRSSSGLPSSSGSAKPPASQIVKINANGFVQTVWFAPVSPIHALYYDEPSGRLYAGAGDKGRIYEIKNNGESTYIMQIEQRAAMVISPNGREFYLGTAESGVVHALSRDEGKKGVYVSRTLDGEDPVLWGALKVRATTPKGGSLTIATRRGNTAKPENGIWTEWSKEQTPDKDGTVKIGGDPARFVQYRATLGRKSARVPSPELDTVELFFLTPNLAPLIKNIAISRYVSRATTSGSSKPPTPSTSGSRLSTSSAAAKPAGPKSISPAPNSNPGAVQIRWTVDEPNSDTFESDLFFKGEDETVWKKINDKPLRGLSSYKFDTATLPDGPYRIRISVSDLPSNPPEMAKKSRRISDHFIVDNTAPRIQQFRLRPLNGRRYRLRATATDAATMIAGAKYSIDAGEWRLAYPSDSIFDTASEDFSFVVRFDSLGEHTVAFMALDREGNTFVAKRVVRVGEE